MNQGARILSALSRIGYPKANQFEGDSFDWLFDCESVVPFLEWFCENIHESNVVSLEDLKRFDELQSSGAHILESDEVDKTLSMLLQEEEELSGETLRIEVDLLGKEVQLMKQRLQKIVSQRNKLSLHHTGLTHKLSKLSGVVQEHKQKYKSSLESSQTDNTQMNSTLKQLEESVSQMVALYGGQEGGNDSESFLSQLPYDSYYTSEERFTGELTAYTKKQFFEGIAEMAGGQEKSRYELLEISDPSTLLVRGENNEVNLNDCEELARLQSVYASSESRRIHNMATATGVTAAVKAAEEKLRNSSWETNTPSSDMLSAKLTEAQKALSQVKMEIGELTEKALPGLVQELGELQATSILKGDYELKIARQDYFTSKQDQVITQLLLQRSRHEFLSMALEVEGRKNRDVHRLFSTLESTLGDAVKGIDARFAIMDEHALHPPHPSRGTIDSRDHFMEGLYRILESSPEVEEDSKKEIFLAYSQLVQWSQRLAGQMESLTTSLASSGSRQEEAWKQLESNLQQCMKTVYGESATTGGLPHLNPQRIADGLSQFDELLVTLEKSIKDIIKDCEAKKKVLRSDSLKLMERELFIYFFTDPPRLKRAIAELSARVDAQIISTK
ncbi:HAUS augmin-like complex subunit 3 [Stylophora pistillata]|uniref:HAUS augmin-like complex subunit 3 n=1 Tax=Stylophora pistillata TaxID=50429 RepID=UPI000C04488C|nr:HAUS augmin-like complex subunit 3 [Stylophora pistillata]